MNGRRNTVSPWGARAGRRPWPASVAERPKGAGHDGDNGEEREGGQHATHEREEQLHGEPPGGRLGLAASRLATVGGQPSQPRGNRRSGRHAVAEGCKERSTGGS